jgi:K+-transporting ATPase KdpF subunit
VSALVGVAAIAAAGLLAYLVYALLNAEAF